MVKCRSLREQFVIQAAAFPPPEVPRSDQGIDCERKFVGPEAMGETVLTLLRMHCLPDSHYPAGMIESIYFDDPNLSSYWEKANGDTLKRKVRIRWYPDRIPPVGGRVKAFLEIKDRLGAGRVKIHHGFVADWQLLQQASLDDPRISRLLREQLDAIACSEIRTRIPSVSIRYHRHRFVCPVSRARICLDRQLSSPRFNPALLPGGGLQELRCTVCEAKSPTHRSWPWTATLFRLGFRSRSFSKYGEFMDAQINRGA